MNGLVHMHMQLKKKTDKYISGTSDSDIDFLLLSNPASGHNVSYLGLCGMNVCSNSYT